MKEAIALWVHSIRRVSLLVLIMGLLLAGFQLLLTLVARSIHRSNAFGEMSNFIPDFMRQLMGPSFIALMSFGGIVCVGYFHIAVMGALIGLSIALATEPASEIETGFMDLLLSRPLARHWLISRSVAMIVACGAFLLIMMMLGTGAGLYWLAPSGAEWPSFRLLRSLALNLGLLILAWGGIALAIGSVSRRRSVAGSTAGLLALSLYLLDYVARIWEPAQGVRWLSPFMYYNPLDTILGTKIPPRNLWILLCIALAGFGSAYVFFSRRDL